MSATPAVNVKYGRSSQRRHHRLTAPLHLVVGGVTSTAKDWSVGGFRCGLKDLGQLRIGDILPVTLCIPFHDFNVSVDVTARVVRFAENDADVAFQFVDLPERAKELLHYFSDNLLRGEMAPIAGTIKRLDLPVTPPRPEVPKAAAQGSARERRMRPWLMGALYLVIGLGLAGSTVRAVYKAIFVVPSEQAMVYTPTVDLIGPEEGTVSAVYVKEGDTVDAGAPLLEIKSPRLDRLLFEARIQEREAKIALVRMQDLIANERRSLQPYATIASDQFAATQARLAAMQEQAALLERQRDRIRPLLKDGYVSPHELDRIESELQRAHSSVLAAEAELRIAHAAQEAARSGRYFTANRLEGELPQLEADFAATTSKVSLAQARLAELKHEAERLRLRAPVAGRVRQLPIVVGSAVGNGMLVASLQVNEAPRVYAVVPAEKLARIGFAHRAKVFVPALSRRIDARVAAIEPRIWTLPDNVRRLLGAPTEGGLVILSFDSADPDLARLQPGLPVAVELGGKDVRDGLRWLANFLGLESANVQVAHAAEST